MARGGGETGESSAKRAKADGADNEEEDPLVLRKEEVVRLLEESSAEGKDNARAKKELSTLCAELEAKNEKSFGGCRLPPDLWQKILDENLDQNDLLAIAMTCRFFREKQKDFGWEMETILVLHQFGALLTLWESGKVACQSLDWFRWVYDTMEIQWGFKVVTRRFKGAVYQGDLVNFAAFQGSVEILRWLIEEERCELNQKTGRWAGLGGSVKVLAYLWERGYEIGIKECNGAACGGHLEALAYLRDLDLSPGTWFYWTCAYAARGGQLEALKWLRDQDPPCPWNEETCAEAARWGHLEVLKWARDQDPPCPWSREECREQASRNGHRHIVKWIRRTT